MLLYEVAVCWWRWKRDPVKISLPLLSFTFLISFSISWRRLAINVYRTEALTPFLSSQKLSDLLNITEFSVFIVRFTSIPLPILFSTSRHPNTLSSWMHDSLVLLPIWCTLWSPQFERTQTLIWWLLCRTPFFSPQGWSWTSNCLPFNFPSNFHSDLAIFSYSQAYNKATTNSKT